MNKRRQQQQKQQEKRVYIQKMMKKFLILSQARKIEMNNYVIACVVQKKAKQNSSI